MPLRSLARGFLIAVGVISPSRVNVGHVASPPPHLVPHSRFNISLGKSKRRTLDGLKKKNTDDGKTIGYCCV